MFRFIFQQQTRAVDAAPPTRRSMLLSDVYIGASKGAAMSRTFKNAMIGFVTAFIAVAGLLYVRDRIAVPKFQALSIDKSEQPPGEPAPIRFAGMSSTDRRDFLNADFTILRKVAELPAGIKKLYMVNGGRVAMANPGEEFEATDLIDPDLPRRRLIFAGVAGDRVFIHYERGGRSHSYLVALFRLKSPDLAVGLWSGYRGRAEDFEQMRRIVSEDESCCNQ
jgi:hypothetical protein